MLQLLQSCRIRNRLNATRSKIDLARVEWIVRMLTNCTSAANGVNKSRMVQLAEYSRDCLRDLRASTGISYDERTQGTLQLFRTQKQVDAAYKDIEVMTADGVPFQVLGPEQCVTAEPGLATSSRKIAGGLRLPGVETGDCLKFTSSLAGMAAAAGVIFRYGVGVTGLTRQGQRITDVDTTAGPIAADAFVLALGSYSPALVKPLGIRLPVYPIKGYSITVPIIDEARAPVSTVMDETYKIAVTRLGDPIRAGGMAEISGFDTTLHPRRQETLTHSVEDLFGGAGDQSKAQFRSGLRPMAPDGTPLSVRRPLPTFGSTPGMARWAGLWLQAPVRFWPT